MGQPRKGILHDIRGGEGMKKSRRKDVIIARIIFSAICLVLICIVSVVVVLVRMKNIEKEQAKKETQSQVANLPPNEPNPNLPPVTQTPGQQEESQTETPAEKLYERTAWTSTGVNLRSEPNETCKTLTVLMKGTRIEITGQAGSGEWLKVSYNGMEGYVNSDFVTDKDPYSGKSE